MTTTRRDSLTAASTADHEHDHQPVPSDSALRAKALESLLVAKGLVDGAALDALVDTYEHKVGPRNGARVVARAWVEPEFKARRRARLKRAGEQIEDIPTVEERFDHE